MPLLFSKKNFGQAKESKGRLAQMLSGVREKLFDSKYLNDDYSFMPSVIYQIVREKKSTK
ncbi:hypothetical protein BpHYR1_021954 [Brachionus plicatilis]|uniref:Uncharacterized protein n=1 Tax=Brachionus plicatilis TaxID=10195 RepID=A0A3M7PDX1_BRAPC|nr:hypothetical protein BpHYR1_021954 [Brachionus plicatilis]